MATDMAIYSISVQDWLSHASNNPGPPSEDLGPTTSWLFTLSLGGARNIKSHPRATTSLLWTTDTLIFRMIFRICINFRIFVVFRMWMCFWRFWMRYVALRATQSCSPCQWGMLPLGRTKKHDYILKHPHSRILWYTWHILPYYIFRTVDAQTILHQLGFLFVPYPLLIWHSYWTWLFIVDLPIKKWWFSIVMLVYQRVFCAIPSGKHT